MTSDEVRKLIRRVMTGKRSVPTRQIRHHVLFKHKCLGKYGFALQWEDVSRLDKNKNSHWLICGDSAEDGFKFFVLPHVVGRRLIGDDPLICNAKNQGSALRAATQNINFHATKCALTARGREECVENYGNRADLFEQWVSPYWHLLNEADPVDMLTTQCPRCFKDRLPNYGTDKHDYQCRNGECNLLWRGDYWAEKRGFWVYNQMNNNWIKWDGKPL